MTTQSMNDCAGRRVPEAHQMIVTGSGNPVAVRCDGNSCDHSRLSRRRGRKCQFTMGPKRTHISRIGRTAEQCDSQPWEAVEVEI